MSIRGEVEYRVFEDMENVPLLQELRTGVEHPGDVSLDDTLRFLLQWIGGIQNGLFLLADHVDELARA